jgi:nucleoside permease NupC
MVRAPARAAVERGRRAVNILWGLGGVVAVLAPAVGAPWSEAVEASGFLGQKLILDEFVAGMVIPPGG